MTDDKGQSLTEMAVIAPLLLLMFIGVVEVGWALRGYMIALQASREAARYAVRGDIAEFWPVAGALNDEEAALEEQGYQAVFNHFWLAFDHSPRTADPEDLTVIIHRYRAYTGRTCEILPCNNSCSNPYKDDDQGGYWVRRQGPERESRIDDDAQLARLLEENLVLNCQKELRYFEICLNWPGETEASCREKVEGVNTDFAADSILVEVFFDQPQLTGFYFFADPIQLWVQTTMRIP